MPQKHGSQMSKAQKSREMKQKLHIHLALDDDSAFFGRVMKINMGRCVVNLWDHEKKCYREVQAVLPNRKRAIIKMNDLVNLAKSHPDWEVQVPVDSKTANELRKMKRISAELATDTSTVVKDKKGAAAAVEDAFEFDYEGIEQNEEELEADALTETKEKAKASVDEDDFDIDDI